MFYLDSIVFGAIFKACAAAGAAFGLGAFEGFVMYAGTLTAGVMTFMNKKKVIRK